jgi:integrase
VAARDCDGERAGSSGWTLTFARERANELDTRPTCVKTLRVASILPKLRCVHPKWALTTSQAATLLGGLAALPRTMVGLALLSGLPRGELFALRWRDIDEQSRLLTARRLLGAHPPDDPRGTLTAKHRP